MPALISRATPSLRTVRIARAVAIVADLLQLLLFPLFMEGFASVLDDVLDGVVSILMIWLLGWHLSFLPAILVEAMPFGDLAPTWTIAVFMATRGAIAAPESAGRQIGPSRRGELP